VKKKAPKKRIKYQYLGPKLPVFEKFHQKHPNIGSNGVR